MASFNFARLFRMKGATTEKARNLFVVTMFVLLWGNDVEGAGDDDQESSCSSIGDEAIGANGARGMEAYDRVVKRLFLIDCCVRIQVLLHLRTPPPELVHIALSCACMRVVELGRCAAYMGWT